MLIAALAWCFLVSGAADWLGLSREMGALMAGVSMSTFPYNIDVIAKVINIRDFFVTLFFVALGMKIPQPTITIVTAAIGMSLFVLASRLARDFPGALLARQRRTSKPDTFYQSRADERILTGHHVIGIGAKPHQFRVGGDAHFCLCHHFDPVDLSHRLQSRDPTPARPTVVEGRFYQRHGQRRRHRSGGRGEFNCVSRLLPRGQLHSSRDWSRTQKRSRTTAFSLRSW